MVEQKLRIELSHVLAATSLLAVAKALKADGYSIFLDFSAVQTPQDRPPDGCKQVGTGGPSSPTLAKLLGKAGVSYAAYFTCAMESDQAFGAAIEMARKTKELRIRAFRTLPAGYDPFSWDTSLFWEAGKGDREETAAGVVIASVEDGSALLVRGDAAAVALASKLLSV